MSARGQVDGLVRRYFLGLIAVAAPLLLLIAGLAVEQFRTGRASQLNTMARDAADLQLMLDEFLKSADDHVRQMRQSAEHHLAGLLPTSPSPLRRSLAPERWDGDGMSGRGFSLAVSRARRWRPSPETCMAGGTFWRLAGRMTGKSTWRSAFSSRCIWHI